MVQRISRPLARLALAAVVAASGLTPAAIAEPTAATRVVKADANGYGGQLSLSPGGSQILRFDEPIGKVLLGDPEIADLIPLNDRSLYVLAKKAGSTSLTVMRRGEKAAPLAAMDVRVGVDVEGLRRTLSEVLPGEPVEVRASGGSVILTGTVSSSAAATAAAAVARGYAGAEAINLTTIKAAEQVMLSVRIAEVQRSALQKLGVTGVSGLWEEGAGAFTLTPGTFDPEAFASLLGRATVGTVDLDVLIDALERKGVATTLAEPTLIALSGETANFFAGGEFPLPVAQEATSGGGLRSTIEFKPYGVSVAFTPTVSGETINLVVAPEVSAIDRENAVVSQGYNIPAITTRRTKTTVELRDGQSFAIAGLIRRDFADSVRGLPGASKIPVLGALFRSAAFNKNETEVLIVVTPRLAKPTATPPRLPTDGFKAPTAAGHLLKGEVEASPAAER
ncbi:MAG TPA: type II and III secretion system protein family protein [Caulobacteraceae bacterium]|nr:type II and III secretion system protein family protein [Caulobacteraceae bacterium]